MQPLKFPLASPLKVYQAHRAEILNALTRVCDSGIYTLGAETQAFEDAFAQYNNVSSCISVGSGTDALKLALRAAGIGPGDEVLTVSHTALATVSAILMVGATPVLIDVEPDFYTLDPAHLKANLTAKTKAILPVHLYGQPCEMNTILTFARQHHLVVIEDCAQAHGATYKGKKVGTLGDAGCFSFYPTKNLGGLGDGGAILTNNASFAERLKRLRQYGWDEKRVGREVSDVSRLDELQAAVLRIKLTHLEEDLAQRRRLAAFYDDFFADTTFVSPQVRMDVEHAYHLYVVQTDQRDMWAQKLLARGIQTGIHYPAPCHLHPGYQAHVKISANGLVQTERLTKRILSLPMGWPICQDELEQGLKKAVCAA